MLGLHCHYLSLSSPPLYVEEFSECVSLTFSCPFLISSSRISSSRISSSHFPSPFCSIILSPKPSPLLPLSSASPDLRHHPPPTLTLALAPSPSPPSSPSPVYPCPCP